MVNNARSLKENEAQIKTLVQNWAKAVRNKDMKAILAHHSDDIVMYDVPNHFNPLAWMLTAALGTRFLNTPN